MVYCKSEKELVDSLVQTVRIFSTDIPVNIGIEKYAVLVMKRGKEFKSEIRNVVKAKIDKSQSNSKCRMCEQAEETTNHTSYMIDVRSL